MGNGVRMFDSGQDYIWPVQDSGYGDGTSSRSSAFVDNLFGNSSSDSSDGKESSTGDKIAGWGGAAGGVGKAITALFFGSKQLRMQKKMVGIQHDQVTQQHKKALLDSSESEVGMMAQHKQSQQDANAQMGAQGISDSSGRQYQNESANYHQDMRLNALRRAKAQENSGYEAQVKIWDLQKKMERAARQEAMISAGIDTAISVAGIASDRRLKRSITPVDVTAILEKVEQLPVSTWRYEWEKDGMRHMGPMAQDFYKTFALGEVNQHRPMHIDFVDLFGVLLASVKGLSCRVETQNKRIRDLEAANG